ncbi:MAG: metalloprotease PmbA [Succinivibrionaceae bacterium]
MKDNIIAEQKKLEELVGYGIEKAKSLGASETTVAINKVTGFSVSCRKSELENISRNQNRSLSITVYCDKRKGETSTNDLSYNAIDESIKAALSIAKHTARDECLGLPSKDELADKTLDFNIFHPVDIEPSEALKECISLEEKAMSADQRITNSLGAKFGSHIALSVFGNSLDFIKSEAITYFTKSLTIIGAKDGKMERGSSYSVNCDINKIWDDSKLINEAVDECVLALGPQKIKTGTYPILFKPSEANSLIEYLINGLSGMSQYYKTSFLLNSKGKIILPEWFQINEQPHIYESIFSRFMDSEGVATKDFVIVENGVVVDYLLSAYSARKLQMKTNGHSGGVSNIFVKDSRGEDISFDKIISKMGKGVVVTSTMGQGVNSLTGDLSLGAQGFWVENGKIQYPISEFTIAGNLKDIYRDIVAIGNDIDDRFNIKIGSVLVSKMKVACL